jgi:hypothetical protein
VVLKLNTPEIQRVIQTFERYDYMVKAVIDDKYNEDNLRENYDSLMKYLNI